MSRLRQPRTRAPALVLTALLTATGVSTAPGHADWHGDDWQRGVFGRAFAQDTPTLAERRESREHARSELVAKIEAELQSDAPLLGEGTAKSVRDAIVRYRAILDAGGWTPIPEGTLRLGDTGEGVVLLRRRLVTVGDLDAEAGRSWQFDRYLEEAVARFQKRHGLRVTGFVDRGTLLALNVSAEDRLRQLQLNLARLIELEQAGRAERYVAVNPATFELEAVEQGKVALRSEVVVGRPEPDRQTPTISSKIVELNFYPYWHVPDSIARRDLIPQLRKDPDYLYRERFGVLKAWGTPPIDPQGVNWSSPEVYDLKFRQEPGPFNALGVVRINMPNVHAVYLHDTPLKQLFARPTRAFSAGCVRVAKVLELAAWLLKDDPQWSLGRVQSAVGENTSLDVKLRKAVPVHFVYLTAWASEGGIVQFRPDIYRRDGTAEALAGDESASEVTSITP